MGHPGIASALETLLRIEDRYETRRVQSLELVNSALDEWTADLALVDGVLIETGRAEALTMPAIVLSGNAADGKRLATRLAAGRGWLRKDATAGELAVAVEGALRAGGSSGARGAVLAAAAALVGSAIVLMFIALLMRGS